MIRLRNIRLSRKLLLICLSFTAPIAVLLYFAVSQVNRTIDLCLLELAGTAYVRPLGMAMKLVGENQILARQVLSGEKGLDAQLADKQTQVDEAMRELERVDRDYGASLGLRSESAARLKGKRVTAQMVIQQWENLKTLVPTLKPEASDEQHMRLVDDLSTLIIEVVDSSHLAIDPDLDAFYLINAAVVILPQAQYRIARSIALGATVVERQKATPQEQTQVAIYASMLHDADYANILASVRTALAEDPAFYGSSRTLQEKVPPALQTFSTELNAFVDLLRKVASGQEPRTSLQEFLKGGAQVRQAAFTFRNLLTDEVDQLLETRLANNRWFRGSILVLSLLTVLLAVLLVARVMKSITVPLAACVQSLDALAAMDLTPRAEVLGSDELGKMAAAVSRAVEELRTAVQSIDRDAVVLSHSSEGMVTTSEQMSANAEETATQANVVSAAAEQVSKNVQSVALATQEMGSSIREVAKQATEAARVATAGVKVAEATNATVAKLGSSSEEIGKVVKVITSIAEQTNLLALNATIEAARVGEAGRGFAVVANEVKELARETASATEEISRKIDAIQSDSREVVGAITQIGAIINQINGIQTVIASAVEEQTVTTREIGHNVAEAANGTSEIARNIMGVAEAARNTSEGAHHAKHAADELQRLAAELKELVGRFKLDA
jgi:methyl-accepting chemotaxis protein